MRGAAPSLVLLAMLGGCTATVHKDADPDTNASCTAATPVYSKWTRGDQSAATRQGYPAVSPSPYAAELNQNAPVTATVASTNNSNPQSTVSGRSDVPVTASNVPSGAGEASNQGNLRISDRRPLVPAREGTAANGDWVSPI